MDYQIPATCPYALKSFKHLRSMSEETLCFEAKLTKNGKVVAQVGNTGQGGENDIYFESNEEAKAFEAYALTLPPVLYENPNGSTTKLLMHAEFLVTMLADAAVQVDDDKRDAKKFAKACSTQTLFRMEGDKPSSWRCTSMGCTVNGVKLSRPMMPEEVQKFIAPKGTIQAILNDLLPSDPMAFKRF